MSLFLIKLLVSLLVSVSAFSFEKQATSSCVCTTVPCPVVGFNYLVEGGGTKGVYYYVQHGNYVVVSNATVTITKDDLDKGTDTTSCTQDYSRMLDDDGVKNCDAGHILAHRLGGLGTQPINIFPQESSINRGTFAQFENQIYDCVTGGATATLVWNFHYANETETKPISQSYTANFVGGSCGAQISQTFPNDGR